MARPDFFAPASGGNTSRVLRANSVRPKAPAVASPSPREFTAAPGQSTRPPTGSLERQAQLAPVGSRAPAPQRTPSRRSATRWSRRPKRACAPHPRGLFFVRRRPREKTRTHPDQRRDSLAARQPCARTQPWRRSQIRAAAREKMLFAPLSPSAFLLALEFLHRLPDGADVVVHRVRVLFRPRLATGQMQERYHDRACDFGQKAGAPWIVVGRGEDQSYLLCLLALYEQLKAGGDW